MDTGCIPPTVNFFQYTSRFGRFSVRVSACSIGASVFFDTLLFPLYPLFPTNRQHFGQKIFFREGKTSSHSVSFALLLGLSYARELLYIRSLLSSFLGGVLFFGGCFFVEPVEKRF